MPTSTLKCYPAYKPSFQPWLGDVPKHWDIRRLNYSTLLIDEEVLDENLPSIALENIESNTGAYVKTITEFQAKGSLAIEDDILFNKLRPYLRKVFLVKEPMRVVGELLILRPEPSVNSRYAYYVLLSDQFIDTVDGSTFGSKMPRASWEYIGNLKIPLPPLPEQIAIARYLDAKVTQIDTLIAAKERLVELLQEQRTALIHRAVTRGLDPDVKLKDSGVEWLGEVPEGWDVVKLKYLIYMSGGGTPSKERPDYWKGSIPWVSPKDMKSSTINSTQDYITETAVEESATSLIDSGAVLIVVRSGILKHTIPVAINEVPVTLNQDLKAITSGCETFQQYFFHFVNGNQSQLLIEWGKQGATVESLESEQIFESLMPVPPKNEQIKILSFLNDAENRFIKQETRLLNTISSLRALRTSLISEVVTGKRDVRGHVLAQAETELVA